MEGKNEGGKIMDDKTGTRRKINKKLGVFREKRSNEEGRKEGEREKNRQTQTNKQTDTQTDRQTVTNKQTH